MSLASCLWPYRSWRLACCNSTVSALILSKKFRQMGVFPRNTNQKWRNFDYDDQRNWSGDVPTMLPSLLFVLFLCQRGQIESWIHTNQMLKCEHYVSDFFFFFLFLFVNFTLMLRLCTVLLPRPRPHFTDVQPTDGDYSDRWCTWSNLVSHHEQKAVCDYWSVLCCFNLF